MGFARDRLIRRAWVRRAGLLVPEIFGRLRVVVEDAGEGIALRRFGVEERRHARRGRVAE